MTSQLRPEMRNIPPPKEYRDPEPPMGMQTKTAPVSGPVNPNVGMPGIALAAQRERNKKEMMNPSGTAASPSGRVRTGVPFNEAPRRGGMQPPPRSPIEPPPREPKLLPGQKPEELFEEINRRMFSGMMQPSRPEDSPIGKYAPAAVQRPPRQLDDEAKRLIMYAKGGMVKASRGDGIASRGRTRGKLC